MRVSLPTDRQVVTTEQLAAQLSAEPAAGHQVVTGARGSAVALVLRQLRRAMRRPLVVITPSSERGRQLCGDTRFVLGQPALLFDQGDQSPYADVIPDRRASHERLAALFELARLGGGAGDANAAPREQAGVVMVVPATALVRKVVPSEQIRTQTEELRLFDEIDRDALLDRLTAAGYLRVPLVEDPGTVAARGALLDVWPPGAPHPVRVTLDGDLVESLKPFDPTSQRSLTALETLSLVPAREGVLDEEGTRRASEGLRELCDEVNLPSARTRALIEDVTLGRAFFGAEGYLPARCSLAPLHDQLPARAVIVVDEPAAVAEAMSDALARAARDEQGKQGEPHYPVGAFFSEVTAIDQWLAGRTIVALSGAPVHGAAGEGTLARLAGATDQTPTLATFDQTELSAALAAARKAEGHGASLDPLIERVQAWHADGMRIIFAARTTIQAERLTLLLQNRELEVAPALEDSQRLALLTRPRGGEPALPVHVTVGPLARGMVAPAEGLVLITEEEIFGSRTHRRRRRAQSGKARSKQLLEDLRSLAVGDFVVHIEHGIGRYEGLSHRQVAGHQVDLLAVAYAGGDKLYLPVYRLNQVHKYRGSEGAPKLDRLGGQSFARSKSRARKRVRQLADELLQLYAERQQAMGEACPPVDDEARAFEATFPFEETDDQARAIEEVSRDLEAPRPMDRLVCGDVGFGKTEIALRAAFRVAMSGRQVALLCPTTVLAQQHALTFESRLAGYPIELCVLSRFRSKKALDASILALRRGTVDVAIGTHRLLSKDVHFKRLGLLVVDEEQRFGVSAKERIKALKANVDVLTLSATPIPRTLQMAVSGIRDLSIMTTPPVDRRAVRTVITRHDPMVIREAIRRELSRGGQVFFVYNRIGGLAERAAMVQQLVPEARIAVVHGQLKERHLEQTMLDFVDGAYDVLCTTAIIENGLDIPRANTIIIDRADRFGLAQLYQLRGRVGRSKERAYCYLVLPTAGSVSDEARQRIEALQRYSDLGSGFQIASLDLDLRGAGDLLGAEQSGSVASVGFEMFCHMLEEAVSELRGDAVTHEVDPELSFDVEALLPERYIADVGVRLSLYKRLASATSVDDTDQLAEEMEDRFGRPPPEARRFVHLMRLKTELRKLKVLACEASPKTVTLHLRDDTPIDPEKLGLLLDSGRVPYRLTPEMRLTRRALPGEIFDSGLEAVDRVVAEVTRCLRAD
ncbi:MAG: transcription-repair coupling factor [Deltaproteobacteria bacterium]|nr:transcription-repair coupling factor [Deltaproteobacteria bacterium]